MTQAASRVTYASAHERRSLLAQFVAEQGYCTIAELSSVFGVSEMTIRRDVARLTGETRLRAFHGGVGSISPVDVVGVEYSDRDLRMAEAKRAIALRALVHIASGAALGIDSGTTAAQLASVLPPDQQIKVITPSLPAVVSIAKNPGVRLSCLGGDFHAESQSFAGPGTLSAISELHIDTLFLSASGLSARGAFCGNSFDAITKRALIGVADHVILIADSSKFSTTAMVRICGWDTIECLIVDEDAAESDVTMVEQSGVVVERVSSLASRPLSAGT